MYGYCTGYGKRLAHLPRRSLVKHGDSAFSGEVFVFMSKAMLFMIRIFDFRVYPSCRQSLNLGVVFRYGSYEPTNFMSPH